MIKVALVLAICCLVKLDCKLGALLLPGYQYTTATLKCLAASGISNGLYIAGFYG